jgi:hypothetical protein
MAKKKPTIGEQLGDENERYFLPDKLRVDLDTDESRKLRAEADAQQDAWRKQFATPFLQTSPAIRERGRALIIVEEFQAIGLDNLLPVQLDQYAEACAELGMFRAAYLAHSDPAHREMYLAFNTALELEDAIWCEHGRAHAYPEKDVWSYVHAREITVMKCALCKFRNAKDIPDHAIEARAKRAEVRQAFSGLTPLEAKARMEKDPRFAHLVRKQ